MKREEVRAFIRSGINELSEKMKFNSGRITEFNSNRKNEYPFVWLEPLKASTVLSRGLSIDDWDIIIHIAKKDAIDSTPEQYESIVDECDYIAQQLIKKYNAVVSGNNLVEITNIDRSPFIHKHADDSTGVILSFVITAPDTTNLC